MMDYVYILMAVGVVGCCLRSPALGIAALGFILPVSKRLPSLPIPLLNTQNLLVLAVLVTLMLRPRQAEKGGGIRFLAPLAIFLLLVTAALANTLLFFEPIRYAFAYDPYGIIITYKNLLTCFLIYAAGCLAVRTREDLDTAIKGVMVGIGFESLFMCAEVFLRGPARANGHLYEGNSAGSFLAGGLALALAMTLMLDWRSREGRFSLVSMLASVIALVFTVSRGNWLGGILVGGTVTILRNRKALVLLVLFIVAYPLWLPQKAKDRIAESFMPADHQGWRFTVRQETDEAASIIALQERLMGETEGGGEPGSELVLDSSSQVRLYVWQAGLKMIQDYPLGVGYGAFPFYLHLYSDIIRFRAAHNVYLQLTAEVGIPGLIAFLTFIGCLFWESLMAYRQGTDPVLRGIGLGAVGTIVGMVIAAIFYNFFFIIEVNGQQWLLLGLATQVRRLSRKAVAPVAAAAAEPVPLYRLVT